MATDNSGNVHYTDASKRTPSADRAVTQYSQTDSRNISSALIRCTPAKVGAKTWHTAGSNPNSPVHLTVEFRDPSGKHITTKHINRDGKAC
ncbi:hypothetical protein F5X98DRAFT_377813 [Xylaria grammica]|nr:hypothetical protein F5X98DRAFT_377813 [Xylaria grammica]